MDVSGKDFSGIDSGFTVEVTGDGVLGFTGVPGKPSS